MFSLHQQAFLMVRPELLSLTGCFGECNTMYDDVYDLLLFCYAIDQRSLTALYFCRSQLRIR